MIHIDWMDGGILYELNKTYDDFGEEAVYRNKESIKHLYLNYIYLGAKFITTNNYAFKPSRQENWKELLLLSLPIFFDIKMLKPNITILGSIPPFHPSYKAGPITQEFITFYKQLCPIINLSCDIFLLETQVDYGHCDHILQIINSLNTGKDIYISFYPGRISGEDIWRLIRKYKKIKAILINCCSFEKMLDFYNNELERVLNAEKNVEFGFYLNNIDEEKYKEAQIASSLQSYKLNTLNNTMNEIKEFIPNIDREKVMIGGCCGYGVNEMRKLIYAVTKDRSLQTISHQ